MDNVDVDRLNISSSEHASKLYPLAQHYDFTMPTQGLYKTPTGWPVGAVVHYTAGRQGGADVAKSTLLYGKKSGYAYLCIDAEGKVHQAHPLNEWGSHCGVSQWPGLNGTHLSNQLIGIEILCPGILTKKGDHYETWFGQVAKSEQIRHINGRDDIGDGTYWKYTYAQETALINLLVWMHRTVPGFKIDYVLGHHEISPGRKTDPGGSLTWSMPEFRSKLYQIACDKNYAQTITLG
jgi:N-acetylmuramoyl-L-alanine amidase